MFTAKKVMKILWLTALAILSGCASPKPMLYKSIEASSYLKAVPEGKSKNIVYSYAETTDWSKYNKIIIDPVTIYKGSDNQLGDLSEKDKIQLALHMHSQFEEKLSPLFRVVATPGPNTLRLSLTLTGVATTTPVLGTLTRFDLSGGLYNGVQSIRGGEGMFTGSVLYVVSIYDTATEKLLMAYIAKEYPNSYNIGATFGSLGAAKTGIEKGAEKLAEQLQSPTFQY